VVGKVVDNALKFSEGSPCWLRTRLDGHELVIRVEDEGIGIAQEHVGRIFDRFRQADSSTTRRHGGVGLGLYLVRTIGEEAGGTVEVHSVPDEGTRLAIRIPTAKAPLTEVGQEADLARSWTMQPSSRGFDPRRKRSVSRGGVVSRGQTYVLQS
jgi:signal transduction histidine kinase